MRCGVGTKTQLSVPTILASLEQTPSLTSCGPIRWSSSAASFNKIPSFCRQMNSCVTFAIVGLAGAGHLRWPDLEAQLEKPAQKNKHLRGSINDLTRLLALPAIWRGSEPSQIVQTLLDVLLRMLSLDFAYARLSAAFGVVPVEILRVAEETRIKLSAE